MEQIQAFKSAADRILARSRADQTEVVFVRDRLQLVRYANNTIHQNVAIEDMLVMIRAVLGKRVGVATCNSLDEKALNETLEAALAIADVQQENPDFVSLPGPEAASGCSASLKDEALTPPAQLSEAVRGCIEMCKKEGAIASGALREEREDMLVANSLGVRSAETVSQATFNSVVMADGGEGYVFEAAPRLDALPVSDASRQALDKALRSREPVQVPSGSYTVVLEPSATGGLVEFLVYLGFGAKSYQEGRSFACGNIGKRVTGENITIWDDGNDPSTLRRRYDYEGVAKQKVMLIERGVLRGVVHDSLTAGKDGVPSTGHALPASVSYGPFPLNVLMAPGESSLEEMIESTERGILVARFHYTNVVEPISTTITGMTRDGTFLIENGKVTRPLVNMRFTQNVLEAFAATEALSRQTKLVDCFGGVARVPAAKLKELRFTGASKLE